MLLVSSLLRVILVILEGKTTRRKITVKIPLIKKNILFFSLTRFRSEKHRDSCCCNKDKTWSKSEGVEASYMDTKRAEAGMMWVDVGNEIMSTTQNTILQTVHSKSSHSNHSHSCQLLGYKYSEFSEIATLHLSFFSSFPHSF